MVGSPGRGMAGDVIDVDRRAEHNSVGGNHPLIKEREIVCVHARLLSENSSRMRYRLRTGARSDRLARSLPLQPQHR